MSKKNTTIDSKNHLKDAQLHDRRLLERHMDKGFVSEAELEKRLAALPDLADQAENIANVVYSNGQG